MTDNLPGVKLPIVDRVIEFLKARWPGRGVAVNRDLEETWRASLRAMGASEVEEKFEAWLATNPEKLPALQSIFGQRVAKTRVVAEDEFLRFLSLYNDGPDGKAGEGVEYEFKRLAENIEIRKTLEPIAIRMTWWAWLRRNGLNRAEQIMGTGTPAERAKRLYESIIGPIKFLKV